MVDAKPKVRLWVIGKIYMMIEMEDKSELRCWVCKRNAKEVEEGLIEFTSLVGYPKVDIEKAIESRAGTDYDDEYSRESELIRLVDTENKNLPYVPLCPVCQGVLLNLGRDAAFIEILDQLEDGELTP